MNVRRVGVRPCTRYVVIKLQSPVRLLPHCYQFRCMQTRNLSEKYVPRSFAAGISRIPQLLGDSLHLKPRLSRHGLPASVYFSDSRAHNALIFPKPIRSNITYPPMAVKLLRAHDLFHDREATNITNSHQPSGIICRSNLANSFAQTQET